MTDKPKRAGRPRENDGMITRPIAATPEQWTTAESIGTTYAQGARMALDMAQLMRPIIESVRDVERSINYDIADAMTYAQLIERLAYYLREEAGIWPDEEIDYADDDAPAALEDAVRQAMLQQEAA